MHEGAIEEGITLTENNDVRAGLCQPAKLCRCFGIEAGETGCILRIIEGEFDGDRILHCDLDRTRAQHALEDGSCPSRPPRLAKVGDMACLPHQPIRPNCHELRVADAETDTVDRARAHSARLAMALTAATVMALPPRRPLTITQGAGCTSHSASLDSAAPTKPTGQPMMAAGDGQSGSSIISSRRNRAVGALPMATSAPARCGRHSSSAAAERVVFSLRARSGT